MDDVKDGPEMLVTKFGECEIAFSVTLRDIKCVGNALAMIGHPYDNAQYISWIRFDQYAVDDFWDQKKSFEQETFLLWMELRRKVLKCWQQNLGRVKSSLV